MNNKIDLSLLQVSCLFFNNMYTCHPKRKLGCKGCCTDDVVLSRVAVARKSEARRALGQPFPGSGTLNSLAQ